MMHNPILDLLVGKINCLQHHCGTSSMAPGHMLNQTDQVFQVERGLSVDIVERSCADFEGLVTRGWLIQALLAVLKSLRGQALAAATHLLSPAKKSKREWLWYLGMVCIRCAQKLSFDIIILKGAAGTREEL